MLRDGGIRAEGSRRRLAVPNVPKYLPWTYRANPSADPSLISSDGRFYTGWAPFDSKKDFTVLLEYACPALSAPQAYPPEDGCMWGLTTRDKTNASVALLANMGGYQGKINGQFQIRNKRPATRLKVQNGVTPFGPGPARFALAMRIDRDVAKAFTGEDGPTHYAIEAYSYVSDHTLYVYTAPGVQETTDCIIYEQALADDVIMSYVNDGTLPTE